MPNILSQGLARHRQRLDAAAGDDAVYVRGNYRITIRVAVGQTNFTDAQTEDVYNELKAIDFVVLDPEKLKIGDDQIEPQRGDRIEFQGYVFQVLASTSGAAWDWSEGRKTFYRIHTSRSGRVASE